MKDERIHDRIPVSYPVCVSVVAKPEISATGEANDISKCGLGLILPIGIPPGTIVRLDIEDSVLYGFIVYSEERHDSPAIPESRSFRTGIDVLEVAMGNSGLSQLLKKALDEVMPNLAIA